MMATSPRPENRPMPFTHSARVRSAHVCSALAVALLAAGCNDQAAMSIDGKPTTNPPGYNREISADALEDDGDITSTGETTHRDPGDTRTTQDEALAGAYNLDDFRGKNRVLLVFAGSPEDKAYLAMKQAWTDRKAGASERNLVLVESLLRGSSPEADRTLDEGRSQVMRARYGVQPEAFKAILIGKDGTVKEEGAADLTFDELFKMIDAMPMRQEEMKTP